MKAKNRGPGRPAHQPTDKTRAEVRALASFGQPQPDMASYIGVSDRTLREHYRDELDHAAMRANAAVAAKLHSAATQKEHTAPSVTAAIFWAKTRMGWKDTSIHEMVGKDGGPIKSETEVTVLKDAAASFDAKFAALLAGPGAIAVPAKPDGGGEGQQGI